MTWIQTYTGRKFSLIDPQPEDVRIEDIIGSLNNLCRFGGHCTFYSVLEHSVRVCQACDDNKFQALLHDAPEAYYGDVTSPQGDVLNALSRGKYREWKTRIDRVVFDALGCPYPIVPSVKHVDEVLRATEKRDLMTEEPEPWAPLPEPLSDVIIPRNATVNYTMFCGLYHEHKPSR